jgi:hypothetical protein
MDKQTVSTPTSKPRNDAINSLVMAIARLARRPEAGALIGTVGVFVFFASLPFLSDS